MKNLFSSIFSFIFLISLSVQGLTYSPTLPFPNSDSDGLYCESFGMNTTYEFIEKVSIGTYEIPSGNNSGYGDYTHMPIEILLEEEYELELTPGHTSVPSVEAWSVWIDYNNNGEFENTELLISERSDKKIVRTFSLGPDVHLGKTRLRVSMQYNLPAGPCDLVSFGEVEDYTLDIQLNCSKLTGKVCDDSDPCTINDTYNSNCECIGFEIGDSDDDGICDVMDECPGSDDQLIGQPCDDGLNCTEEDVYTFDCKCEGRFIDQDEDGYCRKEDPDDTNACIPDFNQCDTPCQPESIDFENGYETWTDGGADCTIVSKNATSGRFSIRIRDNSGKSSSLTSPLMYLSASQDIVVSFSYYAHSMEEGESFILELSNDQGNTYKEIKSWVSGVDFTNNSRYEEVIKLDPSIAGTSTRIRWRCKASSNGDQVYIDDININYCDTSTNSELQSTEQNHELTSSTEINNYNTSQIDKRKKDIPENQRYNIYPNPASQYIKINLLNKETIKTNTKVKITNIDGSAVSPIIYNSKNREELTIDVSNLTPGIYLISILDLSGHLETRKVIVGH